MNMNQSKDDRCPYGRLITCCRLCPDLYKCEHGLRIVEQENSMLKMGRYDNQIKFFSTQDNNQIEFPHNKT